MNLLVVGEIMESGRARMGETGRGNAGVGCARVWQGRGLEPVKMFGKLTVDEGGLFAIFVEDMRV